MQGLYINIPFVNKKSYYQDKYEIDQFDEQLITNYIDALVKEINSYKDELQLLETIYISGSILMLSKNHIKTLLNQFKKMDIKEYTVELKPNEYSHELALLLYECGVNRISLVVESFDSNTLKQLKLNYSSEDVLKVIIDLKNIGITNISIDLLFGLPNQSLSVVENDLVEFEKLDLNHISYYSFILDENTKFSKYLTNENVELIDDDSFILMYNYIIDYLIDKGYEHYQLTNFSKKNKYSKHNMLYWKNKEYIGVGIGAHSFFNNQRISNHTNISQYLINPNKEVVSLNDDTILGDLLINGLELTKGVDLRYIEKKFNINIIQKYPELLNSINNDLLEINNGYMKLTRKGIMLANQVFIIFI